jgi:hypothetical protein
MATAGDWPTILIDGRHLNVASCGATIDDYGTALCNATLFVGQMAYDYEIDDEATDTLPPAVQNTLENDNAVLRIFRPRNDWALTVEAGFVEWPPKSLNSVDPPDATIIARGWECPAPAGENTSWN